ncbi:MAG: 50S ribosomal protein L21 [Caulobacterales bacterium]|nr:50S ribosomal protein L21 [Caulobacterales bacterium]
MTAYAVIKTGGKQYRVAEDDVIVVEKLAGQAGDEIAFEDVLLLDDDGAVSVGAPRIDGARVLGEVVDQRKGEKLLVFKKRRRKNYRRTKGHRQLETWVRITAIAADGKGAKKRKAAAPAPAPAPGEEAAPAVRFLEAPDGEMDDLTKISGVGPKLQEKLYGLGIYHYRQIAAFSDEDVARVDEVLNFKGRIERDDWRRQAGMLASGESPGEESEDGA